MAIPVEPKKVSGQRGRLPTKILLCGAAMMVSIRKFFNDPGDRQANTTTPTITIPETMSIVGLDRFFVCSLFFFKKKIHSQQ
jgi:hypothetical protein